MAKFGNRVKETTDTTGTGTLDLNGAPTGFRAFGDEFTSSDEVYYLIVDDPDNPTSYEYGIGTFTSGTPDTLSRDTVEGSSNGGAKVSFLAGTKTVISTPTAAALLGETLYGWASKNPTVLPKTSNYTVVAADDGKLITGSNASGMTLTLPAAASNAGMVIGAMNLHASGALTLDGNASETINGATTYVLESQYDSAWLWCDGTGWHVVGERLSTVSQAEAEAGTATKRRAWTAERVKQAIDALANTGLQLTAGTAAELNPIAGSIVTTAHGLAGKPQFFEIYLECVTTDGGFSVGDKVWYPPHDQAAAGSASWNVYADETNVVILGVTTGTNMLNKSTRVNFNITLANWKLVVIPYYAS